MNDPREFAGNIRFDTRLISPEEAAGTMHVTQGILNPYGTVHAGALIWFADVVATTLALQGAQTQGGIQGFPLAINLTAQLLSNVNEGMLTGRAKYVKRGRTLQTVRTEVTSIDGKVLLDLTTSHIQSR
jgi:uncharacterized protein (TIGR00369 family)